MHFALASCPANLLGQGPYCCHLYWSLLLLTLNVVLIWRLVSQTCTCIYNSIFVSMDRTIFLLIFRNVLLLESIGLMCRLLHHQNDLNCPKDCIHHPHSCAFFLPNSSCPHFQEQGFPNMLTTNLGRSALTFPQIQNE